MSGACSFEQSAFVSETSSEVLRNVCFCNEQAQLPQGFVLRISKILIFLPQLYDYYLSSSIFDLKISCICNHTFPVYLISTSLIPAETADMHTDIENEDFSPLTTLALSLVVN